MLQTVILHWSLIVQLVSFAQWKEMTYSSLKENYVYQYWNKIISQHGPFDTIIWYIPFYSNIWTSLSVAQYHLCVNFFKYGILYIFYSLFDRIKRHDGIAFISGYINFAECYFSATQTNHTCVRLQPALPLSNICERRESMVAI